jgi:hypothetical protein
MLVDWLKHAFIAKFNHVRATVYGRFTDVLAKDVLLAGTVSSGRKRKVSKTTRDTALTTSTQSFSTSHLSWHAAWASPPSRLRSSSSASARR